jgi:hypothetical protein
VEKNYPSLTRPDVEKHLAQAIAEMAYLTLEPNTADPRHVQAALTLGQQILDVCRTRLKLIDNGLDIAGHPPPSLLRPRLWPGVFEGNENT